MIKTSVISKNYAKALIEAAGETGEYTKYYSQLEDVLNTLENSPDLQIVMANSAIAVSKKIEIGKEISELIMLAGYVYLLVFIVQLIEVLMTSLRTIFML